MCSFIYKTWWLQPNLVFVLVWNGQEITTNSHKEPWSTAVCKWLYVSKHVFRKQTSHFHKKLFDFIPLEINVLIFTFVWVLWDHPLNGHEFIGWQHHQISINLKSCFDLHLKNENHMFQILLFRCMCYKCSMKSKVNSTRFFYLLNLKTVCERIWSSSRRWTKFSSWW